MKPEMEKAINAIATCAEEIDTLNSQISKFIASYKEMREVLETIQETESDIQEKMSVINKGVQQNVEQLRIWEEQKVGDTCRQLIELSSRLEGFVAKSQDGLDASGRALEQAVKRLEPQIETISTYHYTLDTIGRELNRLPELLQISSNLQHALGVMGDTENLQLISEKLDTQLTELHYERDEILKPLKSAAAFSAAVKQENDAIYEKFCAELGAQVNPLKNEIAQTGKAVSEILGIAKETASRDPDSISGKLDQIITMLNEINHKAENDANYSKPNIRKNLFSRAAKTGSNQPAPADRAAEKPSNDTLQTIEEIYNQNHTRSEPIVVKKQTWSNDFVFVIHGLREGRAAGHYYRQGKIYDDSSDPPPINDKKYRLYTGKYLNEVMEKEAQFNDNDELPF